MDFGAQSKKNQKYWLNSRGSYGFKQKNGFPDLVKQIAQATEWIIQKVNAWISFAVTKKILM